MLEDSHAFREYGTIAARDWYMELLDAILSRLTASRPLLGALVERWWDTTDSFHFSTVGEITMTPFDFSMLTSIGVGGHPIPYDTGMGEWDATQIYLLGTRPPLFRPGMVRYSWFADYFRGKTPTTREETEYYARGFLMFLFGTTLFADRANTVGLYLLSALVDLSQLWVYAYFQRLSPEPEVETPPMVLYSHRYDMRCQRRPREPFSFFRRYFDTVAAAEVVQTFQDRFAGAWETSQFRVLLVSPTYLIPPLTSTHRGERDRAPTAAERARGSRLTQAHDRRGSQARRRAGWPELPTTVTCQGCARETYQIPIAPAPAGHELVGASIEYTGQALKLSASLMGMIPFQMPAPSGAPVRVAAGPSAPPPAAGKERRGTSAHSQGRDRRTHTESSSRGPIPDDDESDKELASPQSVSS
ncbi:hypothetical protein CsSME_00040221 [Camellia sinensis var. sinensis]